MTDITLTDRIARELIELLFDDSTPSSRESLLFATNSTRLIDVFDRYCEDEITARIPEITVVLTDEGELTAKQRDACSDPRTISEQFLNPEINLQDEFDYILCSEQQFDIEALEGEKLKQFAANYMSLSPDSEPPKPAALYFEQVLRHLGPDGRGVLFTEPSFRDDADLTTFRNRHFCQIDHIERYDPAEHNSVKDPQAATLITHEDHDAGHSGYTFHPERFEAMLGQRVDSERPFEVAAIMSENPMGFAIDKTVSQTYIDLHYYDFDAALVYDDINEKDTLQGFVSRQQLRSTQSDRLGGRMQELSDETLIKPNAGLGEVIETLGSRRFVFVGVRSSVEGVVTRFDLNRLPVYLHLFDCLSELEIGLRNLIRENIPDWENQTDVYVRTRGSNEIHRDKLSTAQLSSLVEIVKETGNEFLIRRDITGYSVSLDDIVTLRNAVAHYNPIVHTMGGGSTLDSEIRSAVQLQKEYDFLNDCAEGLR